MEQSLLDNDHADYPNKQHVEEAQVQRAVVIHQLDDDGAQPFNWRQFLLFLGPGFLMSIGTLWGVSVEHAHVWKYERGVWKQ